MILADFRLQYDMLSPWFKERVVSRGTLIVEEMEFPYVVCRGDPAAPRWFVGLDKTSGVYFISDEVDENDRELVLRHEMYELGIHEGKGVGRCERAILYELGFCPVERRPAYAQFRLETFEAMLTWINTDPKRRAGYADEQIREMTLARDRLYRLTGRRFTGL